jgi:hypothetical protein
MSDECGPRRNAGLFSFRQVPQAGRKAVSGTGLSAASPTHCLAARLHRAFRCYPSCRVSLICETQQSMNQNKQVIMNELKKMISFGLFINATVGCKLLKTTGSSDFSTLNKIA